MKQKNKATLAQVGLRSGVYSFLFICLMSPAPTVIVQALVQTEARPLLPNQTIKRALRGGDTHSYKIKLRAGQCFHVDVSQRGIDVQLVLVGADGKVIIERDRPNGTQGAESLSFIATTSGRHRLEVRALEQKAETGEYEIKSDTPRKPTAQDRKRVEAETLFQEGLRLTQTATAKSVKQICDKYETAAVLWREVGDKYSEALAQTSLGYCSEGLKKYAKAVAAHERAGALYKELNDRANEANSLSHSCLLNALIQKTDIAIRQYGQAKAIFQDLKDGESEKSLVERLSKIAAAYLKVGLDLFQKKDAETYRNAATVVAIAGEIYHALEDKGNEALSLLTLGRINSDLENKQKALDCYNQALILIRSVDDKRGEAAILNNIGTVYADLDDKQKALQHFDQALTLRKTIGDKRGAATTLSNIGRAYDDLGDKPKALEHFDQALALIKALENKSEVDKSHEATTLNNIGGAHSSLGDKQKALQYFDQALTLRKTIGDKRGEAITLSNIGTVYMDLGNKQKALQHFNQALTLIKPLGVKSIEATTLNNIGGVYSSWGDKQKALDYYNQALALYKAIRNRRGEAMTINSLGSVYSSLGDKQKALDYYDQALTLQKTIENKEGEATTLNNIGTVYADLGDREKALDYYDQALTLRRALRNKKDEATTLANIGSMYASSGDKQKALEYFHQALPLYKEVGDKQGEATTLNNIGSVYVNSGDMQGALDRFDQAMNFYRALGDKQGEATTLNNIGSIYSDLGDKLKAREKFDEALLLYKEVEDKQGEATTLNNIGLVSLNSGDKQKALDYYNQVLDLRKAVGDKSNEAITLSNIGGVYDSLGDKQKALDYYNQALTLQETTGDRRGQATTINNIGAVHADLGDEQKALDHYNRALILRKVVGDKQGEAITLNNMMTSWATLKKIPLVIFYGKQSVNAYQQLRSYIQWSDKELQKTFLRSVEDTYRSLAKLLIEQGRLPEAQQVLNSFKDQQYFDFNADTVKKPAPLAMTQREAEMSSRYNAASDKVGEIGRHLEGLKRTIGSRAPGTEVSAKGQQLEADLKNATDEFLATIKQAETEFSGPPDGLKDKPPDVADTEEMILALQELGARTKQKAVAVYTLIGESNFWALILTPEYIIPVISPAKGKELNEAANLFSEQLRKTGARAKKPIFSEAQVQKTGKELYDLVFTPIAARLKEFNIKPDVLMWSLDGGLRYVPVAALYDGRQYLAERYRNIVFTRAESKRMLSRVSEKWTGWGFYNSLEYTVRVNGKMETFYGLQNAKSEVETIFGVPPAHGIINGKFLPDQQFTRDSLLEKLRLHYPLVHISSHFRLVPGDARTSFLLLGDGKKLTLDNIKDEPDDIFGSVELLTLSACETGLQRERESDGREVDSFAELAQRKGAQAILASLWSVDDKSTSRLMMEFYQKRQLNKLTKAEALQKAQLSLLKDSNYSHPYYWSPFILIGNWR